MRTSFEELSERQSPYNLCLLITIGVFVLLHIILMSVLVGTLSKIAPEVQSTLADVNIIMPEMRRSLLDLGQLLPEIKMGMSVLRQLCADNQNCVVN
jgi:hypothetical protein|tara:strand:- start:1115 stop:1405 length:291 start_codon:yes stop_codon:yes gene_type:complete